MDVCTVAVMVVFQSTFPQGERRSKIAGNAASGLFQSTFPQGERHRQPSGPLAQRNFNPRSHKGNDLVRHDHVSVFRISIHVPTRGTTIFIRTDRNYVGDFNPRSHKGNDGAFRCISPSLFYFNPRSHKGNDSIRAWGPYITSQFQSTFPQGERRLYRKDFGESPGISIHVPTRGTTGSGEAQEIPGNFNPRSHKGNDRSADIHQGCQQISIHVPTRGTTDAASSAAALSSDFNPRSHKGNDRKIVAGVTVTLISIHVPTRGTTKRDRGLPGNRRFQSTFPQGERPQGNRQNRQG